MASPVVSRKKCPNCDDSHCPGPGQLRDFKDWKDLQLHAGEEQLVDWVNHWAEAVEARRYHGKRYRMRQQAFAKVAKNNLDPDEIAEIERRLA